VKESPVRPFLLIFILLMCGQALAQESLRDEREHVLSAHIFHIMKGDSGALEKLHSRLKGIPKSRVLGEFKRLANLESIDPGSNTVGGDLGVVAEGAMDLRFEKGAFALEENVVSAPIQSPFGWHLILIQDLQKEPVAPICASSLELMQREVGDMPAELLRLSLRSNRDFHPEILAFMGDGWRGPLDWEGNLAYARVEMQDPNTGAARVELHRELTYALFHVAQRACTRSIRTTFSIDCKSDAIALTKLTEFEGRGASGRKLRDFGSPSAPSNPILKDTMGVQMKAWACEP
jgi:hypothetical protein